MNQKKAKALRREMQDQNGATKAKKYYRFRPKVAKEGATFIISDEPRLLYQQEKRVYLRLKKKDRAGRYSKAAQ